MSEQPDRGRSLLGATREHDGRCRFQVWAPLAYSVELSLELETDRCEVVPMRAESRGYFSAQVEALPSNTNYFYRLNGRIKRPDPASRYQPNGVHGPSQLRDSRYPWSDFSWAGVAIEDSVYYEIHTGTFTREGRFESIIPRLPALKSLGVTMIELMPIAQFAGDRNWGYDGVYPYAVQNSYGGPDGLKRLVDSCHREGIGVALDVVYNHLGPEGNYLRDFGPYFTKRYKTPWGDALNFDGPESDEVRRFFVENALYWISEFHVDALRLDAIHAIVDTSATPFIEELADSVHQLASKLGRTVQVIAESDLNDSCIVRPRELGGRGFDAQWNDDFHHSLHTLLTGETTGYYQDFGSIEQLATVYRQGFAYTGDYSPYRQHHHGNSSLQIPARRFVVFAQNHDQVGNRAIGDRLASCISFDRLKLAAGAVALAPFLPLLFMGEEYAEPAPFPYFVSHSDPELVENVRKGRREEFAKFLWEGSIPDPQALQTFEQSRLNWNLRDTEKHQTLLRFYTQLFRLRRLIPALRNLSKENMRAWTCGATALGLERWSGTDRVAALFNFGDHSATICAHVALGEWVVLVDSTDKLWLGPGVSVPRTITATGHSVKIELPETSFVLLQRSIDPRLKDGSVAPGS